MKLVEMLDKLENLEGRQIEIIKEIDQFKRDVFGMSDGDLGDLKAFIQHSIRMNKLFKQFE